MKVFGLRGALLGVAFVVSFAGVASAQYVAPTGKIQSVGGGGLWSSPSTWVRASGAGAIPTAGDQVLISVGSPVTLDTNTGIADLAFLIVEDALTVLDTQTYALGTSRLEVRSSGSFVVGTAASRFTNLFTLTLTDTWLGFDYQHAEENRTLLVQGGTIEMHGDRSAPGGGTQASWLRLANGSNAGAGTSTLTLEAAPGWKPGDRIVVASTDFDQHQAEWARIAAIAGNVVTLTGPLASYHHGSVEFGVVDERAEVGLLTKNVRIRGPASAPANQRGGHCMFVLDGTTVPTVHLDWIELQQMGWFGAKGRYPIHIHELGDAPGTYVRGVSISPSYNRAVAIHSTNDVVVEDVVAYDGFGHLFYLEAGDEERNELLHNLGLVTRTPPLPSGLTEWGQTWTPHPGGTATSPFFEIGDVKVSTYWITNTNNRVHDNAAAGSQFHGFWYHLGLGSPTVLPPDFERNVAHSNGEDGFNNEFTRFIAFDPSAGGLNVAAEFEDFTAYKNRNSGIWNRSYGMVRWIRARIADSQVGVYFASEGLQPDHLVVPGLGNVPFASFLSGAPHFALQTLEDSDVVGETSNRGMPAAAVELAWPGGARTLPEPSKPQRELKGIELYDGAVALIGVRFREYLDVALPSPVPGFAAGAMSTYTHRAAMAIGGRGQHSETTSESPWTFDPRNCAILCTFTNVSHAVLFPVPHPPHPCAYLGLQNKPAGANACYGTGIASSMILDLDGCLPGSAPNTWWANDTPSVRPAGYGAPTILPNVTDFAAPIALPVPGQPFGQSVAFFEFRIPSVCMAAGMTIPRVRFTPTARPTHFLDVYDTFGSSCFLTEKTFLLSLLTNDVNLPGTSEEYVVSYPDPTHVPANDPRSFEWHFKFGENWRHVLTSFPYGAPKGSPAAPAPPSLVTFECPALAVTVAGTQVFSKAAVLSDPLGAAWYWDPATHELWFRPTLMPWTAPTVYPQLSGRAVIARVQS